MKEEKEAEERWLKKEGKFMTEKQKEQQKKDMEAAQLLIQKGLIKLEEQPNEGVKKKGWVYVTRVWHDKKKEEASELNENTKDDTMQEELNESSSK